MTASTVLLTLFASCMIWRVGATYTAWKHARLGGVEKTRDLMRADATLSNLWKGQVSTQHAQGLVTTQEGMRLRVDLDGRRTVRRTTHLSKDIF